MIVALLFTCLLTTKAASAPAPEIDVSGTVYHIVDGDTIDAFPVGRIRLADIDAPESGQTGYTEAKNYVSSLTYNKRIYLDVDDLYVKDQYNRLVAVVYVRYDSVYLLNVNKALVDGGYAVVSDYNNEFDPYTWTLYVNYPEGSLPGTYDALLQQYNDLNSKYQSLQQQYATLQDQYNQSVASYNALQSRDTSLQNSYNDLNARYQALQSQFNTLQASYNDLRTKYDDLLKTGTNTDITGLQRNLSDFQNKLNDTKAQLVAVEKDRAELESRFSSSQGQLPIWQGATVVGFVVGMGVMHLIGRKRRTRK